jgi:benzoyl-CoA reductase subunit B
MTIVFNNERYPTRPFQCWQRMKELRREHFWHTWKAQSEGEQLLLGMVELHLGFLAGIGNFANPSIGVHFTRLARTPNAEGIVKSIEAADSWGLGHDICGAMKAHIGQVFQGISQTSPLGEKFNWDFAVQTSACHAIIKTTQLAAEYLGVPLLMIDMPRKHTENARKYLVDQFLDAIEWLENKTGKKFDDEKMIEGVRNEWHSGVMWARCCELLKTIPAPASMREMYSLRLPLVTAKHRKEVADYMDMLYAELKDRVTSGISATGIEKLRLTHENLHPLYHARVLRSPEEYGALFITGHTMDSGFGKWDYHDDGSETASKTPEERGLPLKTREDALNALAEYEFGRTDEAMLPEQYYMRAKNWGAAAVVMHYDRPCQVSMTSALSAKNCLLEKGIPVGTYSASQGDPRDFDEPRVLGDGGDLPTFYETLGLTRLKD